jgi:hypothetical protein
VVLALINVVIWFVLAISGGELLSSGWAEILGCPMPVWTVLVVSSAIAYNVFLVFGVSQLLWFRLATIRPPVASMALG